MDAYAHVQAIEVDFFPDFCDNFNHAEAELQDVCTFEFRSDPIIAIKEAHDHVAVADGIHFVQLQFIAFFVEGSEQLAEHLHDLFRCFVCRVRREAYDVREQHRDVAVAAALAQFGRSDLTAQMLGYQAQDEVLDHLFLVRCLALSIVPVDLSLDVVVIVEYRIDAENREEDDVV